VRHQRDPAPREHRDVRSATAARQLHGRPANVTDVARVEVPEPVHLRAADEPEIDVALRQQTHDLARARRPQRPGDVRRIPHGAEERLRRLVPEQPDLEQRAGVRRVRLAGDAVGEDGQPHADEHQVPVPDLPGRRRDHQLLRGVAVALRHRGAQASP
jgi:hypothetical protein